MSRGARLVRKDGDNVVFELDRPAELTEALLDSLDWPADAPNAAFRFTQPATEDSLASPSSLSAKYIPRIGYTAPASALASTTSAPGTGWRPPEDLEALKTLTRTTIVEHFYEPWRDRETPQFLAKVDSFLAHGLSLKTSALYSIDGRDAGLISLLAHHDCLGRPVDHIAWVWIDARLTPEERAGAHAGLMTLLSGAATGRIHALVHTFNARSRRFFSKIGFTPSCLHISRRP